MHPLARRWLQLAVHRLDAVVRDARRIQSGDPMAAAFGAFGQGSWIDAPQVRMVNVHAVHVGDDVEIRSYVNIEVIGPLHEVALRIGSGTIVGHGTRFVAFNGIEIGERAGIGHGCTIADTVHDWRRAAGGPPGMTPLTLGRPLRIEPGAWIGNHSVLMGGITIGARAVIGANSVITRSVAADAIVAGNPARYAGDSRTLSRFFGERSGPPSP